MMAAKNDVAIFRLGNHLVYYSPTLNELLCPCGAVWTYPDMAPMNMLATARNCII